MAGLETVTCAEGTEAPEESVTLPWIPPRNVCAAARVTKEKRTARNLCIEFTDAKCTPMLPVMIGPHSETTAANTGRLRHRRRACGPGGGDRGEAARLDRDGGGRVAASHR